MRACEGRDLSIRRGPLCVLTSRRPYILDSAAISVFRSCTGEQSRYGSLWKCNGFWPCRPKQSKLAWFRGQQVSIVEGTSWRLVLRVFVT